ncbi:gp019 [Rhodococcus phage ReqiPoco6]|uniref:Gp019 n=1 Tax=Rhodococcus phage ReqiPoco6 TaxID=691964 RepID=D4P7N7_9CAUD|nr:gp019 [Rhodococcus phage ReqiPoco6]ADD81017.1 gp019 [Rhodococcus phage ReqiPoco6]
MSNEVDNFLAHYGVKGMKWGVTKDQHREYKEVASRDTTNMVKRAGSTVQMTRYFSQGGTLKKQQKYTKDWYDKLEGGKEFIEKGASLNRVVRGVDDRALAGRLYVSSLKSDNEMYKAVIPAVQKKFAFGQKQYHSVYQVELETKKRLAMPSQKERVDAFIETIQTPTGRDWMKKNGYKREIDELNAKEMGLKAYKKFNKYAGDQGSKMNDAYFNKLKSRGYDALIDDNDAGIWSKKPMILLSPSSTVKVKSVRQLTADEINQAQRNVLKDRDFKERRS